MTLNNNINSGATKFSGIENHKEFPQPTVLSQSFGNHLFPTSYHIQPFWETLVQQQQQQQQQQQMPDHGNTFAKPIGGSSADSYHESNHLAVLPIGGPRMAIDDLITGPTQESLQQQLMLLTHQLNNINNMVIKDDVFLAQPSTILSRDVLWNNTAISTAVIMDHDDTASLSSHSSLSSSQHSDKLTTSPCLSPVTSPTNFLYNHEPLFEGGIIEDLGNNNSSKKTHSASATTDLYRHHQHQDLIFEDEEYDDLSSVLTDSTTSEDSNNKQQQIIRRLSTVSDDLDWFKLLDAFRADVACDLPETAIVAAEDDQISDSSSSCTDNEDDEDSDEEDEYETIQAPIIPQRQQMKRKRARSETPVFGMYELNLSDAEVSVKHHQNDEQDHAPIKKRLSATKNSVQSNPSQKRRKKSTTNKTALVTTSRCNSNKKYQKKKNDMNPTFKLPANTSITQNQKLACSHTTSNSGKNLSNKDKKGEELDQNKESISSPTRCQLIETVSAEEKEKEDGKTVFQHLTEASIDWCRYCGTTEGVNWRPGPWGKRTLCNKHGCDYKGYGLASRLPRLDLSAFSNEKLQERLRPVVQQFCIVCQSPEQTEKDNHLILCSGGCSRAYHQHCHTPVITVNPATDPVRWYCSALCKENRKRNKVVVELPRKHQPLMHLLPKNSSKKSSAAA